MPMYPSGRVYSTHCPRSLTWQNKNITFNFNQDITSVNIEGLKKGAYDLIFGSYSANEPNIEFVPIIKQEIVAILPAGHPLSRKEALQALILLTIGAWIQPSFRSWQVHTQFLQRTRDCTKFHLRIPGRKRNCLPLWHRGLGLHLWLTLTPSTATRSVSAPGSPVNPSPTPSTWAICAANTSCRLSSGSSPS